jgi:hypothetical protein
VFIAAVSEIVNEAEEITGGLLDATILTQTFDSDEIPFDAPLVSVAITIKQNTAPFVKKVASFFATFTAPETLSIEKTGVTEPNVLLDADDAEIEYLITSR